MNFKAIPHYSNKEMYDNQCLEVGTGQGDEGQYTGWGHMTNVANNIRLSEGASAAEHEVQQWRLEC